MIVFVLNESWRGLLELEEAYDKEPHLSPYFSAMGTQKVWAYSVALFLKRDAWQDAWMILNN